VGRGSGAGSIVSFVLGITNVDPLRHGLYFERFLHPARRDCPDLDIDLCWKRRDEVIEHVYTTYGNDRVAMIATHATLGARSAFRETAKVLGVPNARVNALAKRVPRAMEKPYLERLRGLPEARGVDWREPPLPRALELAERLEGAPRHLSIHCGGLVIADRPLTWYVPLERAAKGIVVTQFEMRAIEAVGLVKMDLLGNRALSTIGECVSLAGARGAVVDVETIPDPDPATARRLAAGDTLNCFQLESPAMRHLLRMLKAGTLEETIAAVALVRPGPAESGMKEAFCRRHRGLEPSTFLHPRLRPVLGSTHGVMLYEEDVMRVAAALADLPLHEGDELRRAIGAARTDEERTALERGFVQCARRAGIDEAAAHAVWRELARFAAYAFCKAHAAGYGTLAYHGAYLKTHFPAEYAVGILNHHAGMYETWVHVEDLRRQGVRFLAPCLQRSAWDATLEDAPAVRVGLSRVFGVGETTGARILRARARRPFASLADVTERARPTLPELESLILAGALDWTGRTRPTLLLEARTAAATAAPRPSAVATLVDPGGVELLPEPRAPIAVPTLPEFDAAERVHGERGACGLWFSGHPLDAIDDAAPLRGVLAAAEIERRVGDRAAVIGLPCAWRRVATRPGGDMLFMTLADRTGLVECAVPRRVSRPRGRAPGRDRACRGSRAGDARRGDDHRRPRRLAALGRRRRLIPCGRS
jgi:DNA-directed DNA polymerase III PolC